MQFPPVGFDLQPQKWGRFWGSVLAPQSVSPNCWGTSNGGPVLGPEMAPKMGPRLVRPQNGCRARVLAIQYLAVSVADRHVCVCVYPSESYP